MKNYKTTLAGLVAALPIALDALVTAYNAGAFTDKSGGQLLVAIGLALFARYATDAKKGKEGLIGGSIPPKDKDEK